MFTSPRSALEISSPLEYGSMNPLLPETTFVMFLLGMKETHQPALQTATQYTDLYVHEVSILRIRVVCSKLKSLHFTVSTPIGDSLEL